MIIAIDFDGTSVEHYYPKLGPTIPGAVQTIKKPIAARHQIILWTMRDGKELQDAVNWYKAYDIPLFGINKNPDQDWSKSPKAYAQLYIDDAAAGCPLIFPPPTFTTNEQGEKIKVTPRPFVNWVKMEEFLFTRGILK